MNTQLIAGFILLAVGAIFITIRKQIAEIYKRFYKVKNFDVVVGLAGAIITVWGGLLVFVEL